MNVPDENSAAQIVDAGIVKTVGQGPNKQIALPKSNWAMWKETWKAFQQSYYPNGMDTADQHYALASLQRYALYWAENHGQRNTPQTILDEAAANEVFYHWYRARQFRRPVAALAVCFTAMVSERPERIIDRQARLKKGARPVQPG